MFALKLNGSLIELQVNELKWNLKKLIAACHLVQLTTDKKRPDALRFYERLGFKTTHEGLKLKL